MNSDQLIDDMTKSEGELCRKAFEKWLSALNDNWKQDPLSLGNSQWYSWKAAWQQARTQQPDNQPDKNKVIANIREAIRLSHSQLSGWLDMPLQRIAEAAYDAMMEDKS